MLTFTRGARRGGWQISCWAERVGFEPTVGIAYSGFQDRHLRPLGHRSVEAQTPNAQNLQVRTIRHSRRPFRAGGLQRGCDCL